MQKNIYRIILVSVMITVLLFSSIITFVVYSFYRNSAETELRTIAHICSTQNYNAKNVNNIKEILSNVSEYKIRFTYINDEGKVIDDSIGEVLENHLSRKEVQEAISTGEGSDTRVSKTIGKSFYYYAIKTQDGILRLSIEYSNVLQILTWIIPIVIAISVMIIIIMGIISVRLSKNLTRPIEDLSKKISQINMYSSRPTKISTDCKELEPIAENTRIMANEIADHLQKIERTSEIRREFTSNVSHELKTPLTTIKGFAEMMKSGMITDIKETAHTSQLIYDESERLLNLINDIIELSHIEENTAKIMNSIRLDTVVNKVVELMSDKAVKFGVHLHINAMPITVKANEGYITEMFINLIDNAIKYNKAGGNVWVKIFSSKDMVVIKISDDGIGIAKQDLDRIFERFYRADKSRSTNGTGLGLSIVKHILAYHDANLEIESKPNEGTDIVIKMKL